MSRHYEAVVVGGRLSSVVTAALLAKRGIRGLLIDDGELASEDPHLLIDSVAAERDSHVMQAVHRELGLADELRLRSGPVDPLLQVVWPDQRLNLSEEPSERLAELRRALGQRGRGIEAFFARLQAASDRVGEFLSNVGEWPATGYFGRRSVRAWARKFDTVTRHVEDSDLLADLDPLAVELFVAPLSFITYIQDRALSTTSVARLARPLARFLAGARTLRSGRTLRGLFATVAQRRAFEIQHGMLELAEPVGKRIQLRLANQLDTISTDAMIDATGALSALAALPHQKRKKDLSETMQTARPRGSLYVLGIEVDDAVIPPGMGQHLLLLNGRKDPSRAKPENADGPIWMTRRPGQQEARTQLVVAHPVSTARTQADSLDALDRMMKARVERVVPFMAEGQPTYSPLSGRGAPRTARPVLTHPHFEPDLDPETGLTGVACKTGMKNVFIAGPAVLPGLGVEGEYLAALQAADACEALLRGTRVRRGLAQR